uniref:Cyclopropane-fatty-acyl-phospholipid synthase n=1 Tax=Candidatus Kentrum sp. TC TaxID=2126339 RepID=A0A450YJZ8_9GAMM|nr:MAG: cyclopropane-fatty-acyl-phospholipid synthase [Candidatus Kentron sp. TC]
MPRNFGIVANQRIMEADKRKSMEFVEDHYEIENALYTRMLDPYMQYTRAYWSSDANKPGSGSIEQDGADREEIGHSAWKFDPGYRLRLDWHGQVFDRQP